jgi:hypothetical protein
MFKAIRSIFHPEGYHGRDRKPPFFEGWFYKLADASGRHRLAVIPGVARHREPELNHAFIQVLDGENCDSRYHRFPIGQFSAADFHLEQSIGPNRFNSSGLELDIDEPEWRIRGKITFGPFTPWPVTPRSPGIMGWYAWVPFMECYHAVVSLDHEINGSLILNGRTIDFSNGRGYLEKDWGRAFPHAYIWLQSNHFPASGTSFMASVAIIPWLRSSFPGFIIGLRHQHRLYRFATYTGALLETLEIGDQEIILQLRDRRHRLFVQAQRAKGGLLYGPTVDGMTSRIAETLGGTISLRLDLIGGRETILEQTGIHAGIDAAGDLAKLLTMVMQG